MTETRASYRTDNDNKWTEVLERLSGYMTNQTFQFFAGSKASLNNITRELTITLNRTANIEMIEHRLIDVVERAVFPVYSSDVKLCFELPFFDLPEVEPPMLRDYDSEFSELMYAAAENDRRVTYKLNFVAITGNILASIILSDLEFWHSPNSRGNSKLKVRQDDEFWVARTLKEWSKITGMTTRQLQRAIDKLVSLDLVIKKNYRFNGLKTLHLRINRKVFVEKVKAYRFNHTDISV